MLSTPSRSKVLEALGYLTLRFLVPCSICSTSWAGAFVPLVLALSSDLLILLSNPLLLGPER